MTHSPGDFQAKIPQKTKMVKRMIEDRKERKKNV